jgi:hypothetical protein
MSMSCDESHRWISMKVDGERVPFSVAGHFDEHLRACVACRELLSFESRRAVILEGTLRTDSAGLKASILRGLEEERGGGAPVVPRFFISRRDMFLRAAAVLLLTVGGWVSLRHFASEGRDPDITRITLERWNGAVLSQDDGSPLRRETLQSREISFRKGENGGGEGGRGKDGDGPGGRGGVRKPVRLDKAKTEYIRLVDFPYW